MLPLLAILPLLGCDGAGSWPRAPAATTAYAAQLASDTAVVTTRRVLPSVPKPWEARLLRTGTPVARTTGHG
jgi:hypothetical protein